MISNFLSKFFLVFVLLLTLSVSISYGEVLSDIHPDSVWSINSKGKLLKNLIIKENRRSLIATFDVDNLLPDVEVNLYVILEKVKKSGVLSHNDIGIKVDKTTKVVIIPVNVSDDPTILDKSNIFKLVGSQGLNVKVKSVLLRLSFNLPDTTCDCELLKRIAQQAGEEAREAKAIATEALTKAQRAIDAFENY